MLSPDALITSTNTPVESMTPLRMPCSWTSCFHVVLHITWCRLHVTKDHKTDSFS